MKIGRRGFLTGLSAFGAIICAPPIVRVTSIMPVKIPFHERFFWEVYETGQGNSMFPIYPPWPSYPGYPDLLEGMKSEPTIGEVATSEGDFDLHDMVPSRQVRDHTGLQYRERTRLLGDELRRYENKNLPRLEILKIGDRVVDKRWVGGLAQIIPYKTQRAKRDDNLQKVDPVEARYDLARRVAYEQVDGQRPLPSYYDSRAAIEARHQPASPQARRRAMEVFERAGLATESRRQAIEIGRSSLRSSDAGGDNST